MQLTVLQARAIWFKALCQKPFDRWIAKRFYMHFYVLFLSTQKNERYRDKWTSLCQGVSQSESITTRFWSCGLKCNQKMERTVLTFLHFCSKLPRRVMSSRKRPIQPEPLQKYHCSVHYFVKVSAVGLTSRVAAAVASCLPLWGEGPRLLCARWSQSCHSHDRRMRQSKAAVQQTMQWAWGGLLFKTQSSRTLLSDCDNAFSLLCSYCILIGLKLMSEIRWLYIILSGIERCHGSGWEVGVPV